MHIFMYNVDFIGHFAFCNYWRWPLRFDLSKTFKYHMWFLVIFLRFELFLDTFAT